MQQPVLTLEPRTDPCRPLEVKSWPGDGAVRVDGSVCAEQSGRVRGEKDDETSAKNENTAVLCYCTAGSTPELAPVDTFCSPNESDATMERKHENHGMTAKLFKGKKQHGGKSKESQNL